MDTEICWKFTHVSLSMIYNELDHTLVEETWLIVCLKLMREFLINILLSDARNHAENLLNNFWRLFKSFTNVTKPSSYQSKVPFLNNDLNFPPNPINQIELQVDSSFFNFPCSICVQKSPSENHLKEKNSTENHSQ